MSSDSDISEAAGVSVIVVSHERPEALCRCLLGVSQLLYHSFEIVVVADAAGLNAVKALPFGDQIKTVRVDAPNISVSRNAGVAVSAGEIVAFIDDDAVPEPTWLSELTVPFAMPDVAAAGGYVIGRNGISLQWGARKVDGEGTSTPLEIDGDTPCFPDPGPGHATRTEGTNCAFRRDTLCALGGFDPAYPFYFDETDLNMRLALAGHKTAIVPRALVHHGFAPSLRRSRDRVPKTLFDIGRSSVIYLRKYAGDQADAALDDLRLEQRNRLLGHMIAGRIEPRAVDARVATLEAGIRAGQAHKSADLADPGPCALPFQRFQAAGAAGHVLLTGRIWQARRLRREARRNVAEGKIVTLILLSPTALFHQVRFTRHGYWEQSGGLFGRAARHDPVFKLIGFKNRVRAERQRVQEARGIVP